METNLGVTQSAFQGTPINSCLPVVGTSSACQWAEGRGNFVRLVRNADGSISSNGVVNDARTDPLIQTDFNLRHEIVVKESMRMAFEATFINLFNQRAVESVYQFMIPTNLVSPTRASRFSGDPQVDWGKVMNGYNYIDALNGTGAFAGVQSKLTLASRYGMPNLWQTGPQPPPGGSLYLLINQSLHVQKGPGNRPLFFFRASQFCRELTAKFTVNLRPPPISAIPNSHT